ncbi:DHA2 family efflux MFS transporter permease subunit [Actinoallomurus purpureus]|nr:DHA2 family efflux MFS transporter permease subunit [Actinoallomurus purpureus]
MIVGLDTTVLNVALPTLSIELRASTSDLQWIVDVYALMAAGLMLFCGSLADRLGRKRVFLAGIVLFTGASVVAAYAGSVATLMVARGAMGVGEALIMPSTLAIIGNVFGDPVERAKAIGIWSAAVGLGIAVGPLVGGWLLGRFWWGSVFLINLPIGVLGLLAAAAVIPRSRAVGPRRLDPLGVLLSVTGPATLVWAIIEGPSRGWGSPAVVGVGAIAVVLTVAFVAWERRSGHPMLPLGIFRHRHLAVGDLLILLGAFALIGTLFVLVQYLQFVLGYPARETGLRLAPTALVTLVAGPLAGVLGQRIGGRWVSAAGMALTLSSLAILGTTSPGDGYGRALFAMLLLGGGAGFIITATSDAIVGSLPEADLGVGSATNSAAIQLGAATGVAVMGSLLSDTYGRHLPAHSPASVKASPAAALHVPGLAPTVREAFVAGMHPAMLTGVGITAVGTVMALLLFPRRSAGRSVGDNR